MRKATQNRPNNRMQTDFGKLRFPQPLMRGVRQQMKSYRDGSI